MKSIKSKREVWDAKAKIFPKFTKDDEDTLQILDFFERQGVDLTNKNVLDVGCGNGRFSLQIAMRARHVYCLDISSRMLESLSESARAHALANISIRRIEWENFSSLEDFGIENSENIDFVFAAMTPALGNKQGFLKALSFSKFGLCYVGFGNIREEALLAELLLLHGSELLLPTGIKEVKQWCEEENITMGEVGFYTRESVFKGDEKSAIERFCKVIEICDTTSQIDVIRDFVRNHLDEDGVLTSHSRREVAYTFIKKPQFRI